MIRSSEQLDEFERWYASTPIAQRSYEEALAIFTALWYHARRINPDFPGDWEEDVKADIEFLNALP